jgi:hypothetical protein
MLSLRNLIHGGVVYPRSIGLLLLSGRVRTELWKVAWLITIIPGSPHCISRSYSSLRVALSRSSGCLCWRHGHLVRLLWSLVVLGFMLWWPKPCTWCRRTIGRTISSEDSWLWWSWLKGPLASLGCSVCVVILLLFQTITDEVIESGAGIGTHMLHHLRT